jgi:hypothetical protein
MTIDKLTVHEMPEDKKFVHKMLVDEMPLDVMTG